MSNLTQPEPNEEQEPRQSVNDNALFSSNLSVAPGRPLLQYRNGFFQGHINEFDQRQGKGVYYWNSGEIYYGDWNLDRMEGEGIFYFALGGYVYGTFLDDKVHGYAILCFSNGDYIAGFWERGLLSGKAVQYSKGPNDWCLYEYKDGTSERTLMTGKGTPPIHTFSMLETYYLKKLIERDLSLFGEENTNQEKPASPQKNIDFLPIDPDGWFHGNLKNRGPHGLGIVCYSEHKSDRGIFKEGAVNGPGRSLFESGDVYDGYYKDGKFHGVGVYFKSETEQYLYGMYENNECVQALTLGNGYPHELMKTIKTDVKLDNIDFIDKETESEVLTLSSQDQSLAEAIEAKDKNLIENVHEGLFDKFLNQGGNPKIIEAPSKLEKSEEEKVEEIVPKNNQSDKGSAKSAEVIKSKKSVEEIASPQKEKNPVVTTESKDNKAKTFNSAPKDHQQSQNELNERKIKTVEIKTAHSIEGDKRGHGKSEGNPDSHRKGNRDISDHGSIDNYISRGNDATEDHVIKNTSKVSQDRSSQNKDNSKANLSNSQRVSEKSDPDFEARRYTFGAKKLGSFSDEQHSSENKSAKNSQYQARTSEIIEKEPSSQLPENNPRPYNKHENNIFSTHNPPADGRPYTEANSPEWRSLNNTPPRSIKSEADRLNIRNSGGDGKINRNEHHSINNEVQKIMEHIFGSGLPSNQDLEDLPHVSQRAHDVNGSFGSPQKEPHRIEYIDSMSFRKQGSLENKAKSVSKSDTDTHSELQAKIPINNKQIEHSPVSNYDNSTPRRDEEKSSDNIRRGSNVESGRMITDTWSLHTGGSQAGGYHGTKTPVLGRGNDGLSSEYNLVREVTSEILDSQRYKQKKESLKSKPNEYALEEKEHSQQVFDDDVFKVMLVKMEMLMREQSKTVESMDEMKRNIGTKGFDSTKEILQRMYNELVELNKLSHISLSVVHTKLDSLLLQQGCKPADLESIKGNTQTLLAQEAMKKSILSSPQRPEIYIVDSQMEHQKRTIGEKRVFENDSPDLASGQLFRSQYGLNHEPRSSASTYEQPNSAHYLLSATKRNSPYKNKDFEYNDDMANYMSVATDSVAKKHINSMTPNSRQFAIRNESTFSQYDDRLQNNSQEVSGHSHLTNSVDKNKSSVQQSVDYIPSTPGKKPGEIAFTTPQSRTHANYQEDYAKRLQTRSPIQSNRSSVIIDANGSPVKADIYASKHSHTSSHSRNNPTLEAKTFSNSPDKFNSKTRNELEEKKNLDNSSVGKYGTYVSKGNENLSYSNHNSIQHNLPEQSGIRERFAVTSNNNRIPNNDEYIHIDKGNTYNRNVKSENTVNSAKKFNEYYGGGGGAITFGDSNVSPNRYRREPVTSPYKQRNTVHEGRLGTVRWRLELEQVEDEYDRVPQRDNMTGEFRVVGVPEQYNSQQNHENSLKSYNQMKNSRSGRPSSMIGVPSQEQRWNEEGPVKQETSQTPYEYNHSSNRQVYKLSEKAKQNFIVDSHMASLAKTSEAVAKPYQEQSFPKRENYNVTSSSYVRDDEVLDERYKNYDTPKKNWDSGMVDSYYRNSGLGQR